MKEGTGTRRWSEKVWTSGCIAKIVERASRRPRHIQLGAITLWWRVSIGLLFAKGRDLLPWRSYLHDPDASDASWAYLTGGIGQDMYYVAEYLGKVYIAGYAGAHEWKEMVSFPKAEEKEIRCCLFGSAEPPMLVVVSRIPAIISVSPQSTPVPSVRSHHHFKLSFMSGRPWAAARPRPLPRQLPWPVLIMGDGQPLLVLSCHECFKVSTQLWTLKRGLKSLPDTARVPYISPPHSISRFFSA